MPQFSGQETIEAHADEVWTFLMDPHRYTACAPTMKNVRVKNECQFTFEIQVMGRPIPFEATWEHLDQPAFARQTLNGGTILTGGAKMQNEYRITLNGPVSTVAWSADVELTGAAKMLVGEAQLRSMVNEMLQDAITCFKGQIETG